MDKKVLSNYNALVRLDLVLNELSSQFPFDLNEKAVYTQHEIKLYQQNYCSKDNSTEDDKSGGSPSPIDVYIVDL